MRDFEMEIKDHICSMLNSGGGVILFDCVRAYGRVLPKGQKMTEKDKESFEQRLQSYA